MKTKLFFSMLCFSFAAVAKTAGAANNDPLILYAIALIILGGLIGTPYIIKFIKKRRKAMEQTNEQNEGNNSDKAV